MTTIMDRDIETMIAMIAPITTETMIEAMIDETMIMIEVMVEESAEVGAVVFQSFNINQYLMNI